MGNRLRGDDAAGPALADLLATRRPDLAQVVVQELLPELAERLAGVDRALFLDASVALPPGEIDLVPLSPAASTTPGLGHSLTPAVLLALAARLYGHAPAAQLLRLGAASFTLGSPLSPALRTALDRAAALVDGASPRAPSGGSAP